MAFPYRNWVHALSVTEDHPISAVAIEPEGTPVRDDVCLAAALPLGQPDADAWIEENDYLPIEMERLPLGNGFVLVRLHMLRLFDDQREAA